MVWAAIANPTLNAAVATTIGQLGSERNREYRPRASLRARHLSLQGVRGNMRRKPLAVSKKPKHVSHNSAPDSPCGLGGEATESMMASHSRKFLETVQENGL
jgi:hypothetical protein